MFVTVNCDAVVAILVGDLCATLSMITAVITGMSSQMFLLGQYFRGTFGYCAGLLVRGLVFLVLKVPNIRSSFKIQE